ncbi:hypothetical protein FYK55_26820 [Roseiconus nitratireducens]|uniref:Uncharacterized protein n=1 Tax=Roseiconus nitratireducens TaxID=2605748 RepID=A0A5M6CTI7_9BACT|nr:hypothetical protein [Roseiconus nitratireducens]KAA5538628.1 hypothetical protein FYK55_26820 [Roseiconus nitratireducens]
MIMRCIRLLFACLFASISLAGEPEGKQGYPLPNWIPGDSPMLPYISKDRLVVSAYSAETSGWAQVKLNAPLPEEYWIDNKIHLTNQSGFVVFQTADAIYAINAHAGQWAHLSFVGKHSEKFEMNHDFVVVSDERGMFVFGRKATEWQGIDRKTGELVNLESTVVNQ